MNTGVVYYHSGTKCIVRLCVSLYSLRRHYSGPVTVLQEGPHPDWLSLFFKFLNVHVKQLPATSEPVLVRKAYVHREMPYDKAIYLDVDTLVLAPIDEFIHQIPDDGMSATWFAGWATTGPRMSKRIRDWEKASPELVASALAFGPAINTGVMGWTKRSSLLENWGDLTRRGADAGCLHLILDEIACQLLLPHHRHTIADRCWNESVKFGQLTGAKIVHFHGRKHVKDFPACALWKETYWRLRETTPFTKELSDPWDDRQLRGHLRSPDTAQRLKSLVRFKVLDYTTAPIHDPTPTRVVTSPVTCKPATRPKTFRDDVTIVTAVDTGYACKLAENLPKWQNTSGLREQNYIVFTINSSPEHPAFEFLRQYPSIKVIEWQYAATAREASFAAFVMGTAKHVATPYWMKLDADTKPISPEFSWPDYSNFTLTAHRWGYTRVKKDPLAPTLGHWLNRLDTWWGGKPLFEPNLPINGRYKHKRIASFCSIEQTAFTRRVADRCGDRLPIPSQDTTVWYAATREEAPIQRINMKQWLMP